MKKKTLLISILFASCSTLIVNNEFVNKDTDDNVKEFSNRFNAYTKKKNATIDQIVSNKHNYLKTNLNGVIIRPNSISQSGKPLYYSTDKFSAKEVIKAQQLQTGGNLNLSLYGEGINLGVWDEGSIFKEHQEFVDDNNSTIITTTTEESPLITSSHGTSVSGIIIARGVANYTNYDLEGIAPKLESLTYYNWNNDMEEIVGQLQTETNFVVSNHSYGIVIYDEDNDRYQLEASEIGEYHENDRVLDDIANTYPYYLYVVSAGNEGSLNYPEQEKSGYDLITQGKLAKNILTVGSVVADDTFPLYPYLPSGFSSAGPTNDGRIKPEVCAAGEGIPMPAWDENNIEKIDHYVLGNGTSFASPSAAGGVALLQQLYYTAYNKYMLSSTVRGLLCHTADDITIWNGKEVIGPDQKTGFGIINLERAANLIQQNELNSYSIIEFDLEQDNEYTLSFTTTDSSEKLVASICWNDPFSTNTNGTHLVHDLDIRVSNEQVTYYPWKLNLNDLSASATKGDNTVDNVEKIEIENPNGTYTLKVSHKGILNNTQKVSLIISGGGEITFSNKTFEDLYPNPFVALNHKKTNELWIKSLQDGIPISSIKIYDQTGRLYQTFSGKIITEWKTNTTKMGKGLYFAKIFSKNRTYTLKILID